MHCTVAINDNFATEIHKNTHNYKHGAVFKVNWQTEFCFIVVFGDKNYVGGNLIIKIENKKHPFKLKRKDGIMFRSALLTHYVTKFYGNRYSMVLTLSCLLTGFLHSWRLFFTSRCKFQTFTEKKQKKGKKSKHNCCKVQEGSER